jgi:hypothetical protein
MRNAEQWIRRRVLRGTPLVAWALALFGTVAYAMSEAPPGWHQLPPPVLTAGVARHTNATWARFSFTDAATDAAFQCSLDRAQPASCTSPKRYLGRLPPGRHRFRVRVIEPQEGVMSPFATYTWWVQAADSPQIRRHPPRATTSTTAVFVLHEHQAHVRLQCRMDGSAWRLCPRTDSYTGLRTGSHRFLARAIDPPLWPSKPAAFGWRVMATSGASFSIVSGHVSGALYPGAAPLAIPVTISNPGDAAIYVSRIAVSVVSSPAGCPAGSNLTLVQSNASAAQPLVVTAHQSVTLPAQGLLPPEIGLRDLATNQDACKDGNFGLHLSGSAGS